MKNPTHVLYYSLDLKRFSFFYLYLQSIIE
jgi:hypothetical protein